MSDSKLILPAKPAEDPDESAGPRGATMPSPHGHTCRECCAYVPNGPVVTAGGHCRLNPPIIMVMGAQQDRLGRVVPVVQTGWPNISPKDWCMQFQPKATNA